MRVVMYVLVVDGHFSLLPGTACPCRGQLSHQVSDNFGLYVRVGYWILPAAPNEPITEMKLICSHVLPVARQGTPPQL